MAPSGCTQSQAIVIHHLLQTFFVLRRQPPGLRRRIIQPEPDHNAEQHRREAFQQEQPLPAVQVQQTVEGQDIAGDDRPQRGGHRHRNHKQRVSAGAEKCREPVGQVQQDTRQETGLGDPHQHAQNIETFGPVANMVAVEAMPHSTMMVAIQRRAPTMLSITLLGMPKMT